MPERTQDLILRFLDTNGNGTGTKNAIGDYSVSPNQNTEFYYEATQYSELHRLIIHISDTTGMQSQDYGNIGSGLTTGYTIQIKNATDGVILDLCDGTVIKTNGSIGRYCYDVDLKNWGSGDEFIQARWSFSKGGSPIVLEPNWKISITLNDDCSGLLEHYFMVQGTVESKHYKYD